LSEIEDTAQWLLDHRAGFLNMMFHSSELIPNSKWCNSEVEIERFTGRIAKMINIADTIGCSTGLTISEYAEAQLGK